MLNCEFSAHSTYLTNSCNKTSWLYNMVGVLQPVLAVVLLIYLVNGKLENVALMKPTEASSYTTWPASNAVDGDKDIHGESRTCYHGLNYPSYWTVDLGQEYQLYEIRVYLRYNFEYRTANCRISLDKNSSRICFTFPSTIPDNPTYVVCNDTGRYVTIRNPDEAANGDDLLNICEVEIYGCSNGTYGLDCAIDCNNCLHCNRWSGVCNEDCYPGWTGDYCNISCSTTTYGRNCNKQCSDRNCVDSTASCDPVTGSCECGPGWEGVDCREVCDSLHYGVNCSRVCSERKCSGNSSCNHVTGSCDQGCEAGWKAKDCIEACDMKHYGSGCTGVCSSRHCNGSSVCSPTTGECEDGCTEGWTGTDCTGKHIMSPPPSPGSIPLIAGATVGGVLLLILVLVLVIVLLRRRRGRSAKESTGLSAPEIVENNTGIVAARYNAYTNAAFIEGRNKASSLMNEKKRQERVDKQASKHFDNKSVDILEEEEEDYDTPGQKSQQEESQDLPARNYYNLDDMRRGHVIPVPQLEARVREMGESPDVPEEEFKHLPDGFIHPYDDSRKPGNKEKNRFKGYYPYNYNRVVLKNKGDGSKGDYINASYVDGYRKEKKYIAAQGPYKDDIIEDFWRMIWQEECRAVVMVTGLAEGGKMKCLRYWPEEGTLAYGDVTVSMETRTQLSDYTVTRLVVHKGSQKRKVTHFHFTAWPDHDVPDTSGLLSFMWRVQKTCGQQKHPIVVHCSAGIGRTGTYIAVESLVSQATTEGTVDVVGFVSNMRGQRKNMIQTKEQYLFTYQAVAAAVVEGDTSLDADVMRTVDLNHVTGVTMGNKTVQQHLETLWNSFEESQTSESVTRIPSYTSRSGFFIMTSHPDKEEVWNQIYNSDSRTLITWAGDDESYLPSASKSVGTKRLTASRRSQSVLSDNVTLNKTVIKKKDDSEGTIIHQYHVTGSVCNPSICVLIDSLLQWTGQPDCGSTTVVSHSISETRLLILLVNITSRLQDDGKVDVISNMRRLQSLLGGPRFTEDDVRLCLEFAQCRLESLGMYANV